MKKIGRLDRTTPIPGRSWYQGAWRTPEEVEARREHQRRKRAATPPAPSKRRRLTDAERRERRAEAYRLRYARDEEFAERERERNRARYVPRGTRARPGEAARRRNGVGTLRPVTPAMLREAATIEAILELVEESLRDDARRYVFNVSLDAPCFEGEPETWLESLADPTHWREPGYDDGDECRPTDQVRCAA